MMAWFWLVLGGLFEVGFTTALRYVDGLDDAAFLAMDLTLHGRRDLALEWFEALQAPDKELVVFERSGHTPHLDEPSRFHDFLTGTVLARTGGSG